MMKQLAAVLISVLLSLGGAFALADAELYYNWDGEFPETPQLEYHAYAVQPNQPDGDALAGAVWPELEWTQTSDADGSLYVLEAEDNSLRGCREFLQVEPGHVLYSRSMTEFPDVESIGGPEAAYQQAYDFASGVLPEDALAYPLPVYQGSDEEGNLLDSFYEITWLQEVEPGVYGANALVSMTVYPGYINYLSYNPYTWQPVEDAAELDYISAEQALASLNYVATHIDPEHTCTTFDDPADEIVHIYPALTDIFGEPGRATLSWAFLIKDARLGYTHTVWVDAVSGDVYDDHDGRLAGVIVSA